MNQMELPHDLQLLDSIQPEVVEAARKKFHNYFNSTRDSWLMNGVVDYYLATSCPTCVDIVVGVREPHDLHFFNKMADCLRSSSRLCAIILLSSVIMRQPTWLYKITQHNIFKELLKVLKTESDVVNLVSGLLTLVILLPMIPASFGSTLRDIFEVFSRLAAWNTTNPNKLQSDQLVHLQISLHFLFHRLYGMYPCNFLSFLRQQYGSRENLAVFSHTVKPMLDTVKMHPLLVTTSKEMETTTSRWKTLEHHDVVVECAKLSIDSKDDNCPATVASFRARNETELRRLIEASGYQELKSAASQPMDVKDLWGGGAPWAERSVPVTPLPVEPTPPTNIPFTPIVQGHVISSVFPHEIGTSPPEAAIEATPETTPVKDPRLLSFNRSTLQPSNSSMARALNLLGTPRWNTTPTPSNSQPSSPMKKDNSPFRFPEKEPVYGETVQRKIQSILQDRNSVSTERKGSNGEGGASVHEGTEGLQEDQEDQEVLSISQSGELSINQTSMRECDSVLENYHAPHGEDLEQCEQESGSPCSSGGLHMPNSTSLLHFQQRVRHRLRYYSQCATDSANTEFPRFPRWWSDSFKSRESRYWPHALMTTELSKCAALLGGSEPMGSSVISVSTFVRRAYSCPDIKKEKPAFAAPNSEHHFDETSEMETTTVTTGTQTEEEDLVPLYPYDHMLLTLFPSTVPPPTPAPDPPCSSPSVLLDKYLDLAALQRNSQMPNVLKNYQNIPEAERNVRDQLHLMHLQLKFERHRRDSHAERNRRLLGKSRNTRWLEEHNAALCDQLALLEGEIHSLNTDINKMRDGRKRTEKVMQEDIELYMDKCVKFEKQNRELKSENQRLFVELKQNKLLHANTTKKLQQVEAMYFTVGQELGEARVQASAGEALKGQLAFLQKELVLMGENVNRSRAQFTLLGMQSGKTKKILHTAYLEQVRALTAQLDGRAAIFESLKARIAELEVSAARKEMYAAEQKRTLKAAKELCREQLEAVESKYKSEMAVNRKLEEHILELSCKLERASAVRRTRRNVSAAQDVLALSDRGGINSPLSLSLSSSEGFSLSSTLTTDHGGPRDLQAVLNAPEGSSIPEHPEFDDLYGP